MEGRASPPCSDCSRLFQHGDPSSGNNSYYSRFGAAISPFPLFISKFVQYLLLFLHILTSNAGVRLAILSVYVSDLS